MFMDITGIDLFDQNVSMTCAEARLRCLWISLVLISFDQNVDISLTGSHMIFLHHI